MKLTAENRKALEEALQPIPQQRNVSDEIIITDAAALLLEIWEPLAEMVEGGPGHPDVGTNTGHGHVWTRPDGLRMRCGGPRICKECALDSAKVNSVRVKHEINLAAIRKAVG